MRRHGLAALAAALLLPATLLVATPPAAADHKVQNVPRSCVPPTTLTEVQAADLSFTRDEERMALDLWTLFADTYEVTVRGRSRSPVGLTVFSNIADSELTHTTTVLAKLKQYCLPDPAWHMDDGEYVVEAIQTLYDDWEADGLVSLEGALQVGIELEERDIDDLEALIAKDNPDDIEQVYVNLCEGSLDHWTAFSDVAGAPPPVIAGRCLPDES